MYISPDASPGDGLLGNRHAPEEEEDDGEGNGSWVIQEEQEEEKKGDVVSSSHVNLANTYTAAAASDAAVPLDESNISYNPLIGMIPFRLESSPEQRPVYRALSAFAITDDDSLLGSADEVALNGVGANEYVPSERVLCGKMDSVDSTYTDMSRSNLQGGNEIGGGGGGYEGRGGEGRGKEGRSEGGGVLTGVASWRDTYMSDAYNTNSARHLPLSTPIAIVETPLKASVHFPYNTHASSSSSSSSVASSALLPSRSFKPSTSYSHRAPSSTNTSTNMFHGLMFSGGKGAASGINEDMSVSVRDMDVGNLSYDTMSFAADRLMAIGQSSVDMNNTEDLLKDIFGEEDDDDDDDSECTEGGKGVGEGTTDKQHRPNSSPPLPLSSTSTRTFNQFQDRDVNLDSDSESDSDDDFNGVFRLP